MKIPAAAKRRLTKTTKRLAARPLPSRTGVVPAAERPKTDPPQVDEPFCDACGQHKPCACDDMELDAAFEAVTGRKRPGPVALEDDEKPLADVSAQGVESSTPAITPAQSAPEAAQEATRTVTFTFKAMSKNGKYAIYDGAGSPVKVPLGAFTNKVAPRTFDATGDWSEPRAAKGKKAKLTAAERIARREARLAADKAKLAATEGAPA